MPGWKVRIRRWRGSFFDRERHNRYGKNLKQRVIAEGVETQGQLAFLQAQNAVRKEGYLFSRPLAAAQLAYLLQTGLTETVLH
jgi:c-di-GMP-related signal transduction protein